jgi:hypothetical protein
MVGALNREGTFHRDIVYIMWKTLKALNIKLKTSSNTNTLHKMEWTQALHSEGKAVPAQLTASRRH